MLKRQRRANTSSRSQRRASTSSRNAHLFQMGGNRALPLYTHALERGRACQAEHSTASDAATPPGGGQAGGVAESATALQQRSQLKVLSGSRVSEPLLVAFASVARSRTAVPVSAPGQMDVPPSEDDVREAETAVALRCSEMLQALQPPVTWDLAVLAADAATAGDREGWAWFSQLLLRYHQICSSDASGTLHQHSSMAEVLELETVFHAMDATPVASSSSTATPIVGAGQRKRPAPASLKQQQAATPSVGALVQHYLSTPTLPQATVRPASVESVHMVDSGDSSGSSSGGGGSSTGGSSGRQAGGPGSEVADSQEDSISGSIGGGAETLSESEALQETVLLAGAAVSAAASHAMTPQDRLTRTFLVYKKLLLLEVVISAAGKNVE
ncbi:MAG: hypothetical protein WDW36_001571 [Sanguina aurantia]